MLGLSDAAATAHLLLLVDRQGYQWLSAQRAGWVTLPKRRDVWGHAASKTVISRQSVGY